MVGGFVRLGEGKEWAQLEATVEAIHLEVMGLAGRVARRRRGLLRLGCLIEGESDLGHPDVRMRSADRSLALTRSKSLRIIPMKRSRFHEHGCCLAAERE